MKAPNTSNFKDRDKEAKFWEDNYRETWETGKPIKARFVKNLSVTINIRLDPQSLHSVRTQAAQKGLGPTQLIRMWIMEKTQGQGRNFPAVQA